MYETADGRYSFETREELHGFELERLKSVRAGSLALLLTAEYGASRRAAEFAFDRLHEAVGEAYELRRRHEGGAERDA